jgi:hypothetical protein
MTLIYVNLYLQDEQDNDDRPNSEPPPSSSTPNGTIIIGSIWINASDESLQIFALVLQGLGSGYLLYFRESFFHIDPNNFLRTPAWPVYSVVVQLATVIRFMLDA